MTLNQLDQWLDEYGRAWERQDVEAFIGCFTADAVYHWGPFGEPLRGTDEIRRRTQAAVAGQSEIAFRHEPLAVTPDGRGICIWGVTYIDTQSGKRRGRGRFSRHVRRAWALQRVPRVVERTRARPLITRCLA
jgi:ketosteroid isomerase-like protein